MTARSRLRVLAWPLDRAGENPYTNNLYAALAALGHTPIEYSFRHLVRARYDVLHVHWPEGVVAGRGVPRALAAAIAMGMVLAVARSRGAAVVWTVHNARPHATSPAAAVFVLHRLLGLTVSGLIFLSEASRAAFAKTHSWVQRKPSVVTPHGRFGPFPPGSSRDRAAVREELNVSDDEFLLAFLGRMEAYKGPNDLVAAFLSLPKNSATRLVMAGKIPSDEAGTRLRDAMRDSEIIVEDTWLSESRFAQLAAAADLVVYPYRRILNSGSALLPIEYGTPVLVPSQGSLNELAAMVGGEWIRTYDGLFSSATIASAVTAPQPDAPPNFEPLEWAGIAAVTGRFMEGVCTK